MIYVKWQIIRENIPLFVQKEYTILIYHFLWECGMVDNSFNKANSNDYYMEGMEYEEKDSKCMYDTDTDRRDAGRLQWWNEDEEL